MSAGVGLERGGGALTVSAGWVCAGLLAEVVVDQLDQGQRHPGGAGDVEGVAPLAEQHSGQAYPQAGPLIVVAVKRVRARVGRRWRRTGRGRGVGGHEAGRRCSAKTEQPEKGLPEQQH